MKRFRLRLTGCQRAVYDYLLRCFENGSGSPSAAEIARGVYFSRPAVGAALDVLEARGIIEGRHLPSGRRATRGIYRVQRLSPSERRLMGWE